MVAIKVTPIAYKPKKGKHYKQAIMILNRSTATCAVVDCKTLKHITFKDDIESYYPLDDTEGSVVFKLKL